MKITIPTNSLIQTQLDEQNITHHWIFIKINPIGDKRV